MIVVTGHKDDGKIKGRKNEIRISLADVFKEIMPEIAERAYAIKGRKCEVLRDYFKMVYNNLLRDYEKFGFDYMSAKDSVGIMSYVNEFEVCVYTPGRIEVV